MNQRQHLRIQIPMAVEISHPSIGSVASTARDISQGGIFVNFTPIAGKTPLKTGAKLKVKVVSLLAFETQATPTVEMIIRRITEEGLGLEFSNKTAKHLWESVQRLRENLEIGRDYFQIYQSVILYDEGKGVLVIRQDGKWLLPGHWLLVGAHAQDALTEHLKSHLDMEVEKPLLPIDADSAPDIPVTEAATFSVIYSAAIKRGSAKHTIRTSKDWRWLSKPRDISDTTFAEDRQRVAIGAFLDARKNSNSKSEISN